MHNGKRIPMMGGTVTPPQDLQPAINALSPMGRSYLAQITEGREITPSDIAKASDYERGYLDG